MPRVVAVIRVLILVGLIAGSVTVTCAVARWRRAAAWAAVITAVCVVVPAVSLGRTLASDDEPLLQAGANWTRNQGLGGLVDRIEHWRYSDPPSNEPATELALAAVADEAAPTPTPKPDVAATPWAPEPLTPVLDEALPGEGQWVAWHQPDVEHALWVTSLRPSAEHASVVATYVHVDPSRLRAVLYAGSELPGGDDWRHQARVSGADVASLVAAFNGGFRFEHIAGGYVSEGRVVRPLVEGEATLAIDTEGRIALGAYGRDLTDDGTWVSLRQNLPLLVDDGISQVAGTGARSWGVDHGGVTYVFRAAVCTVANGHLRFVSAGDVDAAMLADIMVAGGCRTAMQLDINGTWPQFTLFDGLGTTKRTPTVVDVRMGNPYRYLNGSKKDFVALFLRSSTP